VIGIKVDGEIKQEWVVREEEGLGFHWQNHTPQRNEAALEKANTDDTEKDVMIAD
jgi:hypothetical protein